MTTKTSINNVVRKEMMNKEYCQKYPKRKCHENAKGKNIKRKCHETFLGNESPGNNIYMTIQQVVISVSSSRHALTVTLSGSPRQD